MIGEPVDLIVRKNFTRPAVDKIRQFHGVPTGFVVDAQNGTGALDHKIKPLDLGMRFVGPAMTADTEPRDYLPVQPAIALAKPGDILVIATGNYEGAAVIGDNVAAMAKNQGLAAIVTDGLVRDAEGILDVDIPVFCCGVSPNSPYARGPGRIGLPVAISQSVIEPGDIVMGDRDGVVVIPQGQIERVISNMDVVREKEKNLQSQVEGGLRYASWVDSYLESDRTQYVD